jgi:hypothetical protein
LLRPDKANAPLIVDADAVLPFPVPVQSGACAATFGVTGCGSFNLGNVRPQAGKTAEQQQLDTLTCKDQANIAGLLESLAGSVSGIQ